MYRSENFSALSNAPSSRYRLAVTASNISEPIDSSAGRASIINGDVYYSPNSSRSVSYPPELKDFIYIRKTDEEDVKDLHQPLWWSERTAYLAFLPIQPDYSYPFSDLFNLSFREGRTTSLDTPVVLNWKKLETFIQEILKDMRDHYGFPKPERIVTTVVNTGVTFKNLGDFHAKVARLQGWFAVWMAQLSHAIAAALVIDSQDQHMNEISNWIFRLCKHGKWDQAFVSGLNYSVAHFSPDFERVGVFLDILEIIQPHASFSVDFLLRFYVPVWYRWGPDQKEAAKLHPQIARLASPPESLQNAATFILTSPSIQDERPWEAFFAERKRQEPFIIQSESDRDRQKRINRSINHPENRTTDVYVWEMGLDGSYVRSHVDKSRNSSTLADFGRKQKFYNSVFNEWDCGDDLGDPDEDDDSPILYSQFHDQGPDQSSDDLDSDTLQLPPHEHFAPSQRRPPQEHAVLPLQVASHSSLFQPSLKWIASLRLPDHAKVYEMEKYPVMQTLFEYFGFVAPLPVPDAYPLPPHRILDNEIKQICRILGVDQLDDAFTRSVLMQYCFKFLSDLSDQQNKPPSADLFDLSTDNRLYVGATARWHFIEKTPTGWFVLALPSSMAQAPWKLAVNHPIIALLLCRLSEKFSDYELCYILVQRGIQFHTFSAMQPIISPRPLPSLLKPVRFSDYKITYHDYELYLQDRERLLSNPRVRRAALLRGGILWRLVSSDVSASEVLMGPTPSVFRHRQGAIIPSSDPTESYYDDGLSDSEMDALCGLLYCYTGRGIQQQHLSWWPLDSTWRKDVEFPFWNERLESLIQGRLKELESGTAKPLNASEWHRRIRSASNVRRVFKNLGRASTQLFVQISSSS